MLLVVVSGFMVRYLLTYVAHDMADKLVLLQTARGDLDSAWGVLEASPPEKRVLPKSTLWTALDWRQVRFGTMDGSVDRPTGVTRGLNRPRTRTQSGQKRRSAAVATPQGVLPARSRIGTFGGATVVGDR